MFRFTYAHRDPITLDGRCYIRYTAAALRVPTVDVDTTRPGIQTNQVASVTVAEPGGEPVRISGTSQSTVEPAPSPVAVFRPSTGMWFFQDGLTQFGASGDIAVPREHSFFNNDRDELAVFRPSTSTWFVQVPPNLGAPAFQFGTEGDMPVLFMFESAGQPVRVPTFDRHLVPALWEPDPGRHLGRRSRDG